jgi:hypothetical protein
MATTDVLTDVLETVRVGAACYGRVEASAPWGIGVEADEGDAKFHVVLSGECWLDVAGQDPIHLQGGDLVALPHGHAHALRDVPTSPIRPLSELVPERDVAYRFAMHYHPYAEELIRKLNADGLPALLDPVYQAGLEQPLAPTLYQPGAVVSGDFPKHEIDVSDDGPYSIYNWELFFHAPVLVGDTVTAQRRLGAVEEKEGRSGPFVLMHTETTFTNQRDEVVAVSRLVGIAR